MHNRKEARSARRWRGTRLLPARSQRSQLARAASTAPKKRLLSRMTGRRKMTDAPSMRCPAPKWRERLSLRQKQRLIVIVPCGWQPTKYCCALSM
jgi:hypothetical protein